MPKNKVQFYPGETTSLNNFLGQALEYIRVKENIDKNILAKKLHLKHEDLDIVFYKHTNEHPKAPEAVQEKVIAFIAKYKNKEGTINLEGKKDCIEQICKNKKNIGCEIPKELLKETFQKFQHDENSKTAVEETLKEITTSSRCRVISNCDLEPSID